jgi:hypothetical protein
VSTGSVVDGLSERSDEGEDDGEIGCGLGED